MRVALLLCLVMVAGPAAAAEQQLDLICTGLSKARPNSKGKPTTERYKIDLEKQAWCRGDCLNLEKIEAVEPGRLVLKKHEPTFDGDVSYAHIVSRTDGAWSDYFYSFSTLGSQWSTEGTCEAGSFTGMPASLKF